MPKPMGILTNSTLSANAAASVAVSGIIGGFVGLTPGKLYYVATDGTFIADTKFYGRDGLSSNAAIDEFDYIHDVANKIIVTQDSQVGLALSSDAMELRLT